MNDAKLQLAWFKRRKARVSAQQRNAEIRHCTAALTLVELLIVIAMIAILAAMLLPAMGRVNVQAHSASCLNNLKQLQAGWLMYVHDNNDSLPANISRKIGFDQVNVVVNGRVPWILGNARIDTNNANVEAGAIYRHVGSANVYRCPADRSTVRNQPALLRTRSYSLVAHLNTDVISGTILDSVNDSEANLRTYSRIRNPSRTWVLIDEHERSIDDGIFAIPGYGGDPSELLNFWDSFPADRHSNGANLSFADGHADHHRWRFHRANIGPGIIVPTDPQDLADLEWLQQGLPLTP